MRNRIPVMVLDNGAIRYAVYDEKGAFLRYEYLLPADDPTDPGTGLVKGTLLDDEAEVKIWGAAADRTVNDGFHKVSELYQHWWSVLYGQAYSYWEDVKTPITESEAIILSQDYITYSKEISFDSAGNISLVNPVKLTRAFSYAGVTAFCKTLASLAPVYFIANIQNEDKGDVLYYLPAGATYAAYSLYNSAYNDNTHSIVGYYDVNWDESAINIKSGAPAEIRAALVSPQLITVPAGETTYVHSPNRNAYPDSGTVDGMTYKYLGVPFENAKLGLKLETGSYIGTGTVYSTWNEITLANKPIFVIVMAYDRAGTGFFQYESDTGDSTMQRSNLAQISYSAKWESNEDGSYKMSWRAGTDDSAAEQLNHSGTTYKYYNFY